VPNFGQWLTRPAIIPITKSHVRLSETLRYEDRYGTVWTVPKDYVFDGSSIPKALWSVIGHPLQAEWVHAAALHDWECQQRTEPWPAVHRRFYWAMRAGGVGWRAAEIKWAAVRLKGPRW
jgi:hypothetical protein